MTERRIALKMLGSGALAAALAASALPADAQDETSRTDWRWVNGVVMFEGMPDDVTFLGYNIAGVDNIPRHEKPSIYLGLESDYYSDPTTHWAEAYIEYERPGLHTSETNRRAWLVSFNHETGECVLQTWGKWIHYSSDGHPIVIIDDHRGGAVNLIDGASIRSLTNDVSMLRQMNADGSHILPIIGLTANDRVLIGNESVDAEMRSDQRFERPNRGPVLKDRVTGLSYRLVVDNGVLGVERV